MARSKPKTEQQEARPYVLAECVVQETEEDLRRRSAEGRPPDMRGVFHADGRQGSRNQLGAVARITCPNCPWYRELACPFTPDIDPLAYICEKGFAALYPDTPIPNPLHREVSKSAEVESWPGAARQARVVQRSRLRSSIASIPQPPPSRIDK